MTVGVSSAGPHRTGPLTRLNPGCRLPYWVLRAIAEFVAGPTSPRRTTGWVNTPRHMCVRYREIYVERFTGKIQRYEIHTQQWIQAKQAQQNNKKQAAGKTIQQISGLLAYAKAESIRVMKSMTKSINQKLFFEHAVTDPYLTCTIAWLVKPTCPFC